MRECKTCAREREEAEKLENSKSIYRTIYDSKKYQEYNTEIGKLDKAMDKLYKKQSKLYTAQRKFVKREFKRMSK